MKNAHPLTGKWLRELFPEQTKTIPRIIVWTIVYLADVAVVFWLASAVGIDILTLPYRLTTVIAGVYLVIAFLLFWAEAAIYNRLLAAYRNTLT